VLAVGPAGPLLLASDRVIIASGGSGALYRHTTNPLGAIGQGVALAARAGAALADMEFVQFHPTALDAGCDPMPLVSEAVRGEGAVLVDETGHRFMAGQGRAELEPRDVVARAVWRHLSAGHRVFLDARAALGSRFAARFPIIAAACAKAGIDPALEPIPVRPAAHYLMGGIAVDAAGHSSLPGLWACGEAASTGLHGANRLASNSLLEAAATARWVAADIAGTRAAAVQARWPVAVPPAADATAMRDILSTHVGVLRDRDGLSAAIAALAPLAAGTSAAADPACVGLLIAVAALRREESRGSHCRSDFPTKAPRWAQRQTLRLADAEAFARDLLATPLPRTRRA
jgi:L-aspartate oxidase